MQEMLKKIGQIFEQDKKARRAKEKADAAYERYYPRYASMDREDLLRNRNGGIFMFETFVMLMNYEDRKAWEMGRMKAWKDVCKERGYIIDNED